MNVNTVKKRSISKPDKHYTSSDKPLNLIITKEKRPSKKRTSSIGQQKQPFKQLQFKQLVLSFRSQFAKILELAESISLSISKLKGAIILKSVQAKQIYNHLKNGKTYLIEEMKKFQTNFLSKIDFSNPISRMQSPIKQMYISQPIKEKSLKSSKNTKKYSSDSQSIMIDQLKIELSQLQSITHTAISRQNSLQSQLSFRQVQISKYKQLLKQAIQQQSINVYFELINNYKQYKLVLDESETQSVDLQQQIQKQQIYLKELISQQHQQKLHKIKQIQEKNQKLKQLTMFIQNIKQNLNSTNVQYSKINQKFSSNQQQMLQLLKVLSIDQRSNNFFDNFLSVSTKIKQIHTLIINSTKDTLPQKIIQLVSQLSFKNKRILECQNQVKQQKKQLDEANEQFQNVTASYIKINSKHIDLVKSYKLVSSRIEMLQNHNNQLTKLIKRIDQISENQSQGEDDHIDLQGVGQQTIVKKLRKSEEQMRIKVNSLKQQYKISEGVIQKYQNDIKTKQDYINDLKNQLLVKSDKLVKANNQVLNKKQQIESQKFQIQSLQSRLTSLQNNNLPHSQKSQLLQHISKQQLQLNKLSFTFNSNKQIINTLQHQLNQLQQQLEDTKYKLISEREAIHRLIKQVQNLKLIVSEQQLQINTLTSKIYQNNIQIDSLQGLLEEMKYQLGSVKNDLKMQQAELSRCKSILVDLEVQNIRRNKNYEVLEKQINQKQNIIMESYALINSLKNKLEILEQGEGVNKSRKTLFQQLNEMIDEQKLDKQLSSNKLIVPVPQFIQMKSDSGFPMAYSHNEISIQVGHDQIAQPKVYSSVLKQLSSDSYHSGPKLDHYLQHFSSKQRIEQIQKHVINQLAPPSIQNNNLFSNHRISQINIQKPFFKKTPSQNDLFDLL